MDEKLRGGEMREGKDDLIEPAWTTRRRGGEEGGRGRGGKRDGKQSKGRG